MSDQKTRVRFAPSPTGLLHVGNVRTALYNWLYARHTGGTLVLRIEDTDQDRGTNEALGVIFATLRWLGMDWDEGPDVGGPYGPYMQSERLPRYQEAARKLLADGNAYVCFCAPAELEAMREQQKAANLPPRYDRRCLGLDPDAVKGRVEAGEPHVLRFKMPDVATIVAQDVVRKDVVFEARDFDDFIIVKSDGFPVYNFANVVDDATMAITHVIRGDGLLSSMPRQLVIYQALGYDVPQFAHAPMLLTPDRKKLSKRDLAESALSYQAAGFLPEAMVNFLSLLGWSPGDERELFSPEELVREFSIERISAAPAVFDRQKMEWINAQHLRRTPAPRLAELVRPHLVTKGLLPGGGIPADTQKRLEAVVDLLKERARTVNQLAEYMEYFFTEDFPLDSKGVEKRLVRQPDMPSILEGVAGALERVEPFVPDGIETAFRGHCDAAGVDHGVAIHGTRVAVTGQTVGPGLFDLLAVLGRGRAAGRLRKMAQRLRTGEFSAATTAE